MRMTIAIVVSVLFSLPLRMAGAGQSSAGGGSLVLAVDDGTSETSTGPPSDVIFFNQFSPTNFPLELDAVSLIWTDGAAPNVGDPYWIFLYEDPDSDPFSGTVHRRTVPAVVTVTDGVTRTVTFFDPVRFEGPGDVLVAIGHDSPLHYGMTFDTTTPQERSWVVNWDGTMPPPIPADGLGWLVNGNFMIRAHGRLCDGGSESMTCLTVFTDGFESGGTGRWDLTVP